MRLRQLTVMAALIAGFALAATANAATYHYTGTIATGPQYDTYVISLNRGDFVYANLTCAPPPNNTLDTVLSAYAPGADPSDLSNATHYNDDGGPDVCGSFHSSRFTFLVEEAGDWTFRVDGFGSAIGDYVLDIETSAQALVIPTLDELGLVGFGLALTALALFLLRRRRA